MFHLTYNEYIKFYNKWGFLRASSRNHAGDLHLMEAGACRGNKLSCFLSFSQIHNKPEIQGIQVKKIEFSLELLQIIRYFVQILHVSSYLGPLCKCADALARIKSKVFCGAFTEQTFKHIFFAGFFVSAFDFKLFNAQQAVCYVLMEIWFPH